MCFLQMLAFEFSVRSWSSVLALWWALWLHILHCHFWGWIIWREAPRTNSGLLCSALQGETFSPDVERSWCRMGRRACEMAKLYSVLSPPAFVTRVSDVTIYWWPGHRKANMDGCWSIDHLKNHSSFLPLPFSFYANQKLLTKLLARNSFTMGLNNKTQTVLAQSLCVWMHLCPSSNSQRKICVDVYVYASALVGNSR